MRIVTVDPVGPLPRDWQRPSCESFGGLGGLFDSVEVAFGREASAIEVSRGDSFIATTWWTAHIADEAVRSLGGERFLYLIQEYEPFTFPMGTLRRAGRRSPTASHTSRCSPASCCATTSGLTSIGVFAGGGPAGDRALGGLPERDHRRSARPRCRSWTAARTRRLLFYARPEPHAARNMFELGVLALSRALEQGGFRGGWELHGIGTVEKGTRIALGGRGGPRPAAPL